MLAPGDQRLTPQTVQVSALLQGMHARLPHLLGPPTPLRLDLPPDGALATGDAAQLELAVLNLALLNLALTARGAMPQGGHLTIGVGRAHVEDGHKLATGDYICIEVGDTGTGRSETVCAGAIKPFFTTTALGRGSGLGLSQVYGVAQQIGGAVRIDSHRAGHRCTVRLTLPAAAPAPPPVAAGTRGGPFTPAWATAPRQPMVMLVVDDAGRRQLLLLSALNLLGYTRVQAVGSGKAARQLETRPPDVVVLGLPARPVGPDERARRAPPAPRRGRGAADQPGPRAAGAAGHGRADACDPPRRGAAAALTKQRRTTSGTRRWPASGPAVTRPPTLSTPSARRWAWPPSGCCARRPDFGQPGLNKCVVLGSSPATSMPVTSDRQRSMWRRSRRCAAAGLHQCGLRHGGLHHRGLHHRGLRHRLRDDQRQYPLRHSLQRRQHRQWRRWRRWRRWRV